MFTDRWLISEASLILHFHLSFFLVFITSCGGSGALMTKDLSPQLYFPFLLFRLSISLSQLGRSPIRRVLVPVVLQKKNLSLSPKPGVSLLPFSLSLSLCLSSLLSLCTFVCLLGLVFSTLIRSDHANLSNRRHLRGTRGLWRSGSFRQKRGRFLLRSNHLRSSILLSLSVILSASSFLV